MSKNKQEEIIEKELWDHYSELPNPMWYEWKEVDVKKTENKHENQSRNSKQLVSKVHRIRT